LQRELEAADRPERADWVWEHRIESEIINNSRISRHNAGEREIARRVVNDEIITEKIHTGRITEIRAAGRYEITGHRNLSGNLDGVR